MVRANGLIYTDSDEVMRLSKTEEGKDKLNRTNYLPLKWHTQNPPGPNREQRRHQIKPAMFGFMKNNRQDRTKHKHF